MHTTTRCGLVGPLCPLSRGGRTSRWGAGLVLCAGTLAAGAGQARAQDADLIVGDIQSTSTFVVGGSPKAYSLGLALCNLGSQPAQVDGTTFQHPIVTQNMYRLQNGRFEQIGQAWVQHLSSALEQALCATCDPTGSGTMLGVGCSTSDSASAMGQQATAGAKSEVNAATGTFFWPRVNTGDPTTTTPGAFKRLQVPVADLTPGPLYFVSAMVVASDDARSLHTLNNESYRRVTVTFVTSSMPLTLQDTTRRSVPAVQAWKDHGLGANVPDPDVMLTPVDVARDGRFWIACKATDLGGGMWHYEYAVQNFTSDRSGGTFSVPVAPGTLVSNIGFHGVAYHSGEPYSNATWNGVAGGGSVTWTCPETYDQNVNASALRWDTVYNFRFDANVSPDDGNVTIGLFKPGLPGDPSIVLANALVAGRTCGSADFNCDGDTGTDSDIEAFFACLSGTCPELPCTQSADFNGDGDTGTDADIEAFFRVLGGGGC